MDNPKEFELEFLDVSFGHPQFGFITRVRGYDPDDEDMAYQRYLRSLGIRASVVEGVIRVKSPL